MAITGQVAEEKSVTGSVLGERSSLKLGLPAVTEEDNGKFMGVVGGKWAAVELPVYDGAFEVTPSATEDQTLLTAKTYMDADIKIIKIPYSEVLNNSGGTTVNIGG